MKRSGTVAVAAILFIILVGTVSAGQAQGADGRVKAGHLYLFERDPVTGDIVRGGASGIMSYEIPRNTKAMEPFVFTGNRLAPDTDFSLICIPDSGHIVLGQGKSDESGNVHIAGHFNFDAIPIATGAQAKDGARIWLVPSRDVGTYQLFGWHPSEYLS